MRILFLQACSSLEGLLYPSLKVWPLPIGNTEESVCEIRQPFITQEQTLAEATFILTSLTL